MSGKLRFQGELVLEKVIGSRLCVRHIYPLYRESVNELSLLTILNSCSMEIPEIAAERLSFTALEDGELGLENKSEASVLRQRKILLKNTKTVLCDNESIMIIVPDRQFVLKLRYHRANKRNGV